MPVDKKNNKPTPEQSDVEVVKTKIDLHALLEENLRLTREVHTLTRRFNRWLIWQRGWLIFKLIIIVVPIVLGVIYLPPFLAQSIQPYQEFLGDFGTLDDANFLENLTDQFQSPE